MTEKLKKVIFDIETRNIFADVGSDKAEDLDISVLSLYDSETDKYYSFLQEDFEKMWPFFEKADLIVTYNGNHFDIPLLQKYTNKIDLWKINHIDIFVKIKDVSGKMLGLDGVAGTTLNLSKSANGLQAVAWWNSGEIDKIIQYCEQDVKVTKDLYDFALANNKIFYTDRKSGEKVEVKLETSDWEKEKEIGGLFGNSNSGGEPQQMGLF